MVFIAAQAPVDCLSSHFDCEYIVSRPARAATGLRRLGQARSAVDQHLQAAFLVHVGKHRRVG